MRATTLLMLLLCACGGQYTVQNKSKSDINDGGVLDTFTADNTSLLTTDSLSTIDHQVTLIDSAQQPKCPSPGVGLCIGSQGYLCDSTGKPIPDKNCNTLDFYGVSYTCKLCKNGIMRACTGSREIWIEADLNCVLGHYFYVVRDQQTQGCPEPGSPSGYARFTADGTFKHQVVNGTTNDPKVYIELAPNFAVNGTYQIERYPNVMIGVGTLSNTKFSTGKISFSRSGTKPGDTWSLTVNGTLEGVARGYTKYWTVSYNAGGIITPEPK